MRSADEVDEHVGRRLRQRRNELGISQEKLGAALGLTFQQVQKYEKGQNRIGAGRLYRIATILSVPVQYFFDNLPDGPEPAARVEHKTGEDDIRAFATTPEGRALSAGFVRIPDSATRRCIVDLVRAIARTGG